MVRSSCLRALVGLATGLGLALAATTTASPAVAGPPAGVVSPVSHAKEYDAPLELTIDELTPGIVPAKGPITVRGTVTNTSVEEWRGIQVFPMSNAGADCAGCPPVITTETDLAAAASSDPDALVGNRITAVYAEIPVLAPGESASYELRLKQAVLRTLFPRPSTGVHWFGVHALGSSDSSAWDKVADGKARTFLPSVAPGVTARVDAAVVVPLRTRVAYATDGSLLDTDRWQEALDPDGSLGGPLAFAQASGAQPMTWLLDPAVPDAIRHLAHGNQPRTMKRIATEPEETDGTEGTEPSSGDPSAADGTTEPGSEEGDGADDSDHDAPDPTDPLSLAAAAWLEEARDALTDGSDTVALLPYGDPDLSALGVAYTDLYTAARQRPLDLLTAWGVQGMLAAGAPNGYLSEDGIAAIDDGAAVLLGDRQFPVESFGGTPPAGALIGDRAVVVTSHGASSGGPGPDRATAPVALRQRLLSEAVIRLIEAAEGDEATSAPLVVVVPATIDAAGADNFWDGLDHDWLNLTTLASLVGTPTGTVDDKSSDERQIDASQLTYPAAQERAELPASVIGNADQLLIDANLLQQTLGEGVVIDPTLVDEALSGLSYGLRTDAYAAQRLERTHEWVREQLDSISIDAPEGVTLSGTSGTFNIAISNDLDFPVTVHVAADTADGADIVVANPVEIAAHSRASVPISAEMSRTGVHNVTLQLTDEAGTPLGVSDVLPIRSGQVGVVIWVIIGTGAGILFLAIGIRLFRRFRRRAAETPEQEPQPQPQPQPTGDADGNAGTGARE